MLLNLCIMIFEKVTERDKIKQESLVCTDRSTADALIHTILQISKKRLIGINEVRKKET